jgi:accessory gene regulator B
MIDGLAYRVAGVIKRANPHQTSSHEVLHYILIIYINLILIVIESLIIGWLSGKLWQTITCMVAVNGLRYFSGGKHLRSTWGCNLLSVGIFTIVPHVPLFHPALTMITTVLSLLLVFILAPNMDSQTSITREKYPKLKLISLLIVGTNLFIHSWLLGLSFFVQSLTLLFFERR